MTEYEKDSFIDAVEVTLDYNEPVSEEDYALYEELIKERSSRQNIIIESYLKEQAEKEQLIINTADDVNIDFIKSLIEELGHNTWSDNLEAAKECMILNANSGQYISLSSRLEDAQIGEMEDFMAETRVCYSIHNQEKYFETNEFNLWAIEKHFPEQFLEEFFQGKNIIVYGEIEKIDISELKDTIKSFREFTQILEKCKEIPEAVLYSINENNIRLKQGEAEIALELGLSIYVVSNVEGDAGSDKEIRNITKIRSKDELINYRDISNEYSNMIVLQPNYPEEAQQIIANYLTESYKQRLNVENGKYEIEKSQHTKTGEDVWLVKINNKLDRDEFLQEEQKMKELGGFYSKYTHSFVFKENPSDMLNKNSLNSQINESTQEDMSEEEIYNNITVEGWRNLLRFDQTKIVNKLETELSIPDEECITFYWGDMGEYEFKHGLSEQQIFDRYNQLRSLYDLSKRVNLKLLDVLKKGKIENQEDVNIFLENSEYERFDENYGDLRTKPIELYRVIDEELLALTDGIYAEIYAEIYAQEKQEREGVIPVVDFPQEIRYYKADDIELSEVEVEQFKNLLVDINRINARGNQEENQIVDDRTNDNEKIDEMPKRIDMPINPWVLSKKTNDNFKLEQVSVRLNQEAPLYSKQSIETAGDAIRVVGQELMIQLDREQICIINLNSSNKPINFSITSVGTLNHALVEPREMLKASILSNAGSVIMLHNHPSGNLKPSKEDYQITMQMVQSFGSVGIKVLDHVIIAGNNSQDFYSLREEDIRMFEGYQPFSGELKFSDIGEHLLREISVFLVAEDLAYWINNTHNTISLTNEEAELILNYMDGHGYNLGVEEGNLVRVNQEEDSPTVEKYNINEAIYAVCDWNAELISETNENIHVAISVEEVCKLREYMKTLRADEGIIDKMFQKTSLGKTLELGIDKQEKKKSEHKKEKAM